MKKKNNRQTDIDSDFIRDVVEGRNVKAKEKLEKALKLKTAKRIKDTLAS